MSNNSGLLNQKYYFLRRSVISYYTRCMKENSNNNSNYYDIPCDFDEIMKFVSDLYLNYLRDEYKEN